MRRGKVYHDLNKSDYKYTYKNLEFVFSSKFYIDKFTDELYNYIKENTKKINEKFLIYNECSEYLALSLYIKIEKRGFMVFYKNKAIDNDFIFESLLKI